MKQYLKLKTRKLFYGKYPYKITTLLKEGHWFRTMDVDTVIKMCLNIKKRNEPTTELLEYSKLLKTLSNTNYKLRIERSVISLFVKDKQEYQQVISALEKYVYEVAEPEDDVALQTMSDNKKIVVCDALPHGKYTHKIIFKQMPPDVRTNLFEWAKKYDADKIRMSGNTESYLSGKKQWCFDPFIYVGDGKMLMMLGLSAQGYIRKTEEFIPRSSINTSS